MEKYDKGYHKGVRWITDLSRREDVNVAKLFMDMGIKIRSIRNLLPPNFLVTDRVFFSNSEKIDHNQDRKTIKQMFTTNDVLYINQYKLTFEELWKNGIDAVDIIEDIEGGLDTERVDIISRSNNAETAYLDLLRSSNKEIMLILPTVNSFLRQWKLGVFELITRAAVNRNVKIPCSTSPEQVIALWARHGREIFTRIAPIMRVVRDAAGADQDMATQWRANEQERITAFRVLAQMLADRDGLKPTLTVGEATDIIFALLGIELYLIFASRGWTPEHWEQWTIATLTATLLR